MRLTAARFDVDHVRRQLEERLAGEGLAPLDGFGGLISNRGMAVVTELAVEARSLYLGWARGVLSSRRFFAQRRADASVTTRDVWRLHARGRSNAEVARELQVSRGVVEKALRMVVKHAGPPPVANPWRRSGRDAAWAAVEAKRKDKRMANETKQGPGFVRYAVIKLKSMEEVEFKGKRHSSLIDVDGRAHVGGIDVKLEDCGYRSQASRKEMVEGLDLVITVPWHKINVAERVIEGAA